MLVVLEEVVIRILLVIEDDGELFEGNDTPELAGNGNSLKEKKRNKEFPSKESM